MPAQPVQRIGSVSSQWEATVLVDRNDHSIAAHGEKRQKAQHMKIGLMFAE